MGGNEEIIEFISKIRCHSYIDNSDSEETIRRLFRAGYCYYFAIILKEAFNRGEICWCAPFGHICWVDVDGTPYDIEGVCDSDCDYYIPVSYIEEGLDDFKHVPGKTFNASEEYINNAIERYKEDNNIK